MSAKPTKLMLLEFNELCPSLMEKFIAAGELPNFKRLYDESQTFVTDAEEQMQNLEPWIQWVTLHTGLSYQQHGIFALGDAYKLNAKPVWDMISLAGHNVWVCGSMNVKYDYPINGLVLPDAWSSSKIKCASELEVFCNFVRSHVQEHSNDSAQMKKSDYLKVLGFLLSHGLSMRTITDTFKQLSSELIGKDKWKRALILDKLQWDVFAYYYKNLKPDFSTFFSNAVAHFQHKYWRNMEPELFNLKPSTKDQSLYKDAILFAYKETDKLVGRALTMADDDTTIVFATALSQQPYVASEDDGGKQFYRPKNFDHFLAFAEIKNVTETAPAMSEDFVLYFDNEVDAEAGMQRLQQITVDGAPLMKARREDNEVYSGCQIFADIKQDATLGIGDKQHPFFDILYKADSMKSGMHHPDGLFWVRGKSRQHTHHENKLPLRAIAPEILSHFGINKAPEMVGSPVKIEF